MSSQRDDPPGYQSYLLRLWRMQSAGETVWRAALEAPLTQEVFRFDSLPGLFTFLQAQTRQAVDGDSVDGEAPRTPL